MFVFVFPLFHVMNEIRTQDLKTYLTHRDNLLTSVAQASLINIEQRSFQVTTHPGYTSTALQNDIALLRLSRNVVFRSGLRPACLPDQYAGFDLTSLRTPPVVVGWGSTVTGGATVNALREVCAISRKLAGKRLVGISGGSSGRTLVYTSKEHAF